MKTISKINSVRFTVLIISALFLANCRTNMGKNTVFSRSLMDGMDLTDATMLIQVVEQAQKDFKDDTTVIRPNTQQSFDETTLEARYVGKMCECYVPVENVLQPTLKSDSTDCIGKLIGYQYFRLARFKIKTNRGRVLHYYTFAAIKQDDTMRLQNFYISQELDAQKFPKSIHFVTRCNYDLSFLKKARVTRVDYDFEMTTPLSGQNICFTKIISRGFNMIGGDKALVFDIVKSFDEKGIKLTLDK